MKYRIPDNADLDRAFSLLEQRARQEGFQFSGNTKKGTIVASGQTVKYTVVGNMINIVFPNFLVEMAASGQVKALLDDTFN